MQTTDENKVNQFGIRLNITVKEIFELYCTEKKEEIKSLEKQFAKEYMQDKSEYLEMQLTKLRRYLSQRKCAFKHCSSIENVEYRNLRAFHITSCFQDSSQAVKKSIKNLFYHLDNWAIDHDIIIFPYSNRIKVEQQREIIRQPFSEEEITKIWEMQEDEWAQMVLIYLYTGMRSSELLNIRVSHIDLEERTITCGTKTANSKNRIIPVHSKILSFIEQRAEGKYGHEYLFTFNSKRMHKETFFYRFKKVLRDANTENRTVHDCRHTFRSRLDNLDTNQKCIDLLMGHASYGAGRRVYTHKTLNDLRNTIELLD